jgi:hypothetical protein
MGLGMKEPWEDTRGLERLWSTSSSKTMLDDLIALTELVPDWPEPQPLVLTQAQYEILAQAMQRKNKPQPLPGFNRAQRRARKRAGLPYKVTR